MIAEVLAFTSALMFALGTISIRKGLDESNFISATLVTIIIGTIIFWLLVPFTVSLNEIDVNGILLFLLSGATAIGVTRLVYFKGMKELGASINASIVATNPMISSLIAVFLLGEHPTLTVWIGMIIVISGTIMIERSTFHQGDAKGKMNAFIYPFLATFLAGSGVVIRKMTYSFYDEPLMGAAIGYSVSIFIYILISILSKGIFGSIELTKRTFKLFWKGALFWCLNVLCNFYAFRYGDVSIVTPILNIGPLFVLLLAHLFLKKQEKVTLLLFVGTIMIVIGISLITVF